MAPDLNGLLRPKRRERRQRCAYPSLVLRAILPEIRAAQASGAGHIENEAEPGIVAAAVCECDAPGASAYEPSHLFMLVGECGIIILTNRSLQGVIIGMTAEELWNQSGLDGKYEAWSFGEAPDKLAGLIKKGIKTATCSAYDLYLKNNEPIPKAGDYSVILDSDDEAVCIIQTTKVYVVPFHQVTEEHAFKEGEGDRTLKYWREVHEAFLSRELSSIHRAFNEDIQVVCEEFELVEIDNPSL